MKTILLLILISILIIILRIYLKYFRPLKPTEEGFEFVYVENNGNVRELDDGEMEYLKDKFHPNDGGRPYIQTNYKQLTADGKISGFIYRIKVPKNISIQKEKANV